MTYLKAFFCAVFLLHSTMVISAADMQRHSSGGKAAACINRKAAARTIAPLPQASHPQPPTVKPPVSATIPLPTRPSAPIPLTTCDRGGCWDAGGNRYNGGIGNTYLDKDGHPCIRTGTVAQCF